MSFVLRGEPLAWMTIASCGWAMLLFGYDQGVMSGLISAPAFQLEVLKSADPSASISGLVVAIYEIGAFAGAISVILFGNKLGRRVSIGIGQALAIIGAILQASSFSLAQIIVARIVTGIGVGQITATAPVWMAEIAPAARRGRAGGLMMICGPGGLVISYWIDYAVSGYTSAFSFRFPLALQIVFCLGQLATMPFLPESPRWLIAKGRTAKAKAVVAAIYDIDDVENSTEAQQMFTDVEQAVMVEQASQPMWKEVFSGGPLHYRRRVLLSFATQALQQLAGINVLAYYSTVIFKQYLGQSNHIALILGGSASLAFFVGGCIGMFVADKIGRRKMLMWGFTTASIGMIITAVGTSHSSHSFGILATFGIFFYEINFGFGLLIPPWLYGVEIMPLKFRALSGSLSAASGWIWNYAVVQITQPGLKSLGYRFFIIWAALNFLFVWVVYFFYPETSGKTLEEIDFIFESKEQVLAQTGTSVEHGEAFVGKSEEHAVCLEVKG